MTPVNPTSRARWLVLVAMAVAAGGSGCPESSGRPDAGDGRVPDDGRAEGSVDVGGDAVDGGDGSDKGGRLTLVVSDWAPITDRLCDLDGDGREDNAMADLGTPMSDVFAATLASMLGGTVESGSRLILLFPWVEDVGLVEASAPRLVIFEGYDIDSPRDITDDFSGSEPFFVHAEYMDGCGEPTSVSAEAALRGGELTAVVPVADLHLVGEATLNIRDLRLTGTVAPGGAEASIVACGVGPIADLGSSGSLMGSGLSLLEELLFGGAAFGVPTVPGLAPDVDLDGDGLESFVVDSEGRIESCVDGDRSVIVGRDCWADARMADGISLTLSIQALAAAFGGRRPGWEFMVDGECPDGPPEESLLDSPADERLECAPSEGLCDPRAPVPCCDPLDTCSGANCASYRCFRSGCLPQRCDYGGEPGFCINPGWLAAGQGVCAPLSRHTRYVRACEPETTGCTTDYDVSGDTACVEVGEGFAQCREVCSQHPEPGCDEGHFCSPRRFYEDGICVTWAYESR